MMINLKLIVFLTIIGLMGCSSSKERSHTEVGDVLYSEDSIAIGNGKDLFTTHCSSCHSVRNEGIGPRLGGITTILNKNDLTAFINAPSKVLNSGNLRANYLKQRYKTEMPPFKHLGQQSVSNILSFLNFETQKHKLAPMIVDTTQQFVKGDRVVSPVLHSGLNIEFEDFVQIPTMKDRMHSKGLATLRAHPSGDGALFISDQMGVIYKIDDGMHHDYLNVRERILDFIYEPGIGTGLGSFDFHPDFLNNGLLYTTHAEDYNGKVAINQFDFADSVGIGLQWVLVEWALKSVNLNRFEGSRKEVLRVNTPTTAHGFQDITFSPVRDRQDPDYAKLYIGIGDGGSINIKKPELSHNINSLLGTIIRIDPQGENGSNGEYGIPTDNPFADSKDKAVRKEIWAYGFRNPHRFCWDNTYGQRLIIADIGESNIEEINIVEKGGDYGWSNLEGTFGIDIMDDPKVVYSVSHDYLSSYHLPFGQFDHMDGKAISGGFVYTGEIAELKNKYVFGDIVTGKLFYMNIDKSLSDSTIYDLTVVHNGEKTGIMEMSNLNRAHMRLGYDQYSKELFVMTKADGMVRKVIKAYHENDPI